MAWFVAAAAAGSLLGAGLREFCAELTPDQKRALEQVRQDLAKAQRERQLENMDRVKRQGYYDMVLCPTPFLDITGADGWTVVVRSENQTPPPPPQAPTTPPPAPDQQPQPWQMNELKGPIVCVRGCFNKGKSFVLNELFLLDDKNVPGNNTNGGSLFPSGDNIHTEGLSFKMVTSRGRPMLFLDTAGSNSPIASFLDRLCVDYKASEGLIRDVAFHMADMFIEVVNDIGFNEQEEIAMLCLALQNRTPSAAKKSGKVVVIHNFRDVSSLAEFEVKKTAVKKLFGDCELVSEDIEAKKKTAKVEFLDGYGSDKPGSIGFQQHFFLGKEGSEAGALNPWVMMKIMSTITNLPLLQKKFDLKQRLEEAINTILPNYLDPEPPKVQLDLTSSPAKLRFVGVPPPTPATPGPRNGENVSGAPPSELPPVAAEAAEGFRLKAFAGQISSGVKNSDCSLHLLENATERLVLIFMAGVQKIPDLQYDHVGDEYVFTVEGYRECPAENGYTTIMKDGVSYGDLYVQFRLPANSTNTSPDKVEWSDGLLRLVFKKVNRRSGRVQLGTTENGKDLPKK